MMTTATIYRAHSRGTYVCMDPTRVVSQEVNAKLHYGMVWYHTTGYGSITISQKQLANKCNLQTHTMSMFVPNEENEIINPMPHSTNQHPSLCNLLNIQSFQK